jgi:hypothetical protein
VSDKHDNKNDGTRRFTFDDLTSVDPLKIMAEESKAKPPAQSVGKSLSEAETLAEAESIINGHLTGNTAVDLHVSESSGVYYAQYTWALRRSNDPQDCNKPPQIFSMLTVSMVPEDVLEELVASHEKFYGRPFELGAVRHEGVVDSPGSPLSSIKTHCFFKAEGPGHAHYLFGTMVTSINFMNVWNRMTLMLLAQSGDVSQEVMDALEKITRPGQRPY